MWEPAARAGIFDLDGRMFATAKQDITLFREAGAIVEQSSTEIWRAGANRRNRVRCNMLARRAGRRQRAAVRGPFGERGARHHRLDGSSGRDAGRAHQCGGTRRAPLCGRQDFTGNGNAEADVAARTSSGRLRCRMAVLRSHRFSDVARDRRRVAIDLHGDVQMDLSRA